MGISAVIITFNEAAKIADCVRSVSWADEVIVVDSHSTDNTREIAEGFGARVIERDWPGFARQKQFAADAASHDLILSIDADEVVTDELANEIQRLDLGSADAFRMPRLSYYLGKPIRHGSWYPDKQIRLFDRRKCSWTEDVIHESVSVPSGKVIDLQNDLLHFSSDGVRHHAEMLTSRYAPLGAEKLRLQGRKVGILQLLLAGPAAFFSGYLIRLGFLDGVRGLIIATFAGYNSFLKYALRYEEQLSEQGESEAAKNTTNERDRTSN